MRRNARYNQHEDDYPDSSLPLNNISMIDSTLTDDLMLMDVIPPAGYNKNKYRFENTIEVKVEVGDTLQAIALRFHCTVADIRRLNKIDKDNEIHARNVLKIPVTVHNVLLDNLPIVHKSGNNSPKVEKMASSRHDSGSGLNGIIRNPLEDAEAMLSEKLLVAAVNSSGLDQNSTNKTKVEENIDSDIYRTANDFSTTPQLHRIKGPSFRIIDWSGSDCDMSWICLFVVILALCFVIPLVYVFHIAEHSHHNTTGYTPTPHQSNV